MDGFKFFFHLHAGEKSHKKERDKFAVEHSPALAESHVVEILLTPFALDIAKSGGKTWFRVLMLLALLLDNILQFSATTCCLILLYGAFD